jgi:23S rRNA (uracil1939-C5)-methyltransferase
VRKKRNKEILQDVPITGYAAEGRAIARLKKENEEAGKILFVSSVIPGDRADILVVKNKKDWAEGRPIKITHFSSDRIEPFCRHFGVCGGCKWQMLPYQKQLEFKQQEAEQNIKRIGRQENFLILPIAGSEKTKAYRNKLEFTASNKEYIVDLNSGNDTKKAGALGFHVPRIFDKTIDIYECHLMDDVNNRIRNTIRDYALYHQIEFYDIREHTGWLRNIIIRYCTTGELMVNVIVNYEDDQPIKLLLNHLLEKVPHISTLLYTVNTKWNDSIFDLKPVVYFGNGYVIEKLGAYKFMIGPKSFFQTNTAQAEKLYTIAAGFAALTGIETVYDLYCGTGSIGIFMSNKAKKIIGVEIIEEAIEDAKKNAELNNVGHINFFAGDVIKICNNEFFAAHGRPDVILTDPPRAGMHEKLVNKLLEIEAPKIVYISCNTATQARDIALLSEKYKLIKLQPVDMFPHTHHIESVALLTLKEN